MTGNDILLEITPHVLLKAYACGIFPMAESADDPGLYWIEPEHRGIIPLDQFHVSRSLAKTVRSDRYSIRFDSDFRNVIDGCAQPSRMRPKTWINHRIRNLYVDLFDMGYCHSVEAYDGTELVGGLYGVHLGGAFFGESMFSRRADASKVALVHLVARLRQSGFVLLDTQFVTDHLRRFGAIEINRKAYHQLLEKALTVTADFQLPEAACSGSVALQAVSHTS